MSTGNVGGPGQKPTVTTTEPGEQEDVNLKGKLPGGPEVTKEEGATPIQDGSQPQNAGASDTTINSRKTELTHYFDPTVSQDEDEDGEYDVFMTAVDDPNDFTLFTQDQVNEIEQAALEEAGLSHDEVVESAVGTMKDKSTVMKSFKKVGDMFASAFRKFADVFRPEPKVAEAMAEGIGQLIDVTTADMNEEEAVTATSELISNLESNPNAVLEEIGNKGLTDVIADIKETMRVATKKNLLKMKSMLSESADSFPALQDMSDEARELMINATLSAARLGNPGSTKTDVTQLESRGYIIGKIPTAKLILVEAILKSSPEFAIEQLKGWLPDTNFGSEIDEILERQSITNLFGGNEIEVDDNPQAPARSQGQDGFEAARTERKALRSENRNPDLQKAMDAVISGITPETVANFKVAAKKAKDEPERDLRYLFRSNDKFERLEVDENPEGPQVDPEATKANQIRRAEGVKAEKREEIRKETELRRAELMTEENMAAAKAHGKKLKNALETTNPKFNSTPNRVKELDKAFLAQYEEGLAKIEVNGGLTPLATKELEKLQTTMEETLRNNGAPNPHLMAKGIMVATKLAAWTEPESSDKITLLGGTLFPRYYSDALGTAGDIAEQDPAVILKSLFENPAIKHSDFEEQFIPMIPMIPGEPEDE